MIKYLNGENFKKSLSNNVESIYHFSVADYYDPNNINFGKLRVFNVERILPKSGFDLHQHRNLELINYVLDGKLSYKDSLNNFLVLNKGDIQHISAGKGVYHSELNLEDSDLHLIHIWILPNKRSTEPTHSIYETASLEINKFHKVASPTGPLEINQDVNIYILKLDSNNETFFKIEENRQGYFVQISGESIVNNINFKKNDALEVIEEVLSIKALTDSHFILIEMRKS